MFSRLMTFILEKTCSKHIISARNSSAPYMIRYILLKTKYLSIYFHRFMRSDDDTPHTHPWSFISLAILGGYVEHLYNSESNKGLLQETLIIRKPLSLAYRGIKTVHKVEVDKVRSLEEINDAPLTVVMMFKRKQVWGFIKLTESGFTYVNWKDYLGISPNDPRYWGQE